jgi:hypothetical protein
MTKNPVLEDVRVWRPAPDMPVMTVTRAGPGRSVVMRKRMADADARRNRGRPPERS